MRFSSDDDYQIEPAGVGGGGDVGKIDWVIRDFLAKDLILVG